MGKIRLAHIIIIIIIENMKITILFFSFLITVMVHSQENCNLQLSQKFEIYTVDTNDIKCIAEDSNKKNTLLFTFGVWCEPCRLHLPNAIKFAEVNDVNFYVLLVEAEEDLKTKEAFDYLKKIDKEIKIVILKDEIYGIKRNKKNKKFLSEITPKEYENIDDYSKYILLNDQGEVLIVTNWKDNKGNDWRDDTPMIKRCLLPLLK
jgi:thiol-disulfide isomerase/thioredoxin